MQLRLNELLEKYPDNIKEIKAAITETDQMSPELSSEKAKALIERGKLLAKWAVRVENITYEEQSSIQKVLIEP
jgi:hypothetical protein